MISVLESLPISTEQLEHLRYLHSTAERYKDSIYARAYTLLTAAGVQVGLTAAFAALFRDTYGPVWAIMFRVLIAVVLMFNVGAAATALHAIMPHRNVSAVRNMLKRLVQRRIAAARLPEPTLSSFNRVCEMDATAFMQQLGAASTSALYADLAVTYFNLCHIVNDRYAALRRAYLYEEVALLAWAGVGILMLV